MSNAYETSIDDAVVIIESEEGIGFGCEHQVIDGPQLAADFEVLGEREIIEYVD